MEYIRIKDIPMVANVKRKNNRLNELENTKVLAG